MLQFTGIPSSKAEATTEADDSVRLFPVSLFENHFRSFRHCLSQALLNSGFNRVHDHPVVGLATSRVARFVCSRTVLFRFWHSR